ncbi:MAG TPA: hypothetical protein VMY99_05090 [Nevskiaceae bacterium]|nr:hypothetical protein [Nevskiaceae bacterium]
MQTIAHKFVAFLASRRFFYGVLIFFVLQAAWIACSATYPMPFDEDFHLGIITIYSHHWSPFLAVQPEGGDAFGALARDPSYLYHYLMSFPYRLLALITDSQTAQIIVLRVMNVSLFTAGLALFRRVLLRAGLSRAFTHTSLMLFVLIPIVPQLAAQVNYDNLLMPLVAWILLLVFSLLDGLKKRRIDAATVGLLASLCLLTSLVKYAFLPILAAIVVFVGIAAWRYFDHNLKHLWHALWRGVGVLSRPIKIGLVVALALSAGLFVQRYGINMVTFHSPVPDCGDVLSMDHCSAYGPWIRNYNYALIKDDAAFTHNPIYYLGMWLYWLWYRLFFAISGPNNAYTNYPPLPWPAWTFVTIAVAGLVTAVWWGRRALRNSTYLQLFLLIVVLYVGALFAEDYSQYLQTGQPVAINGRYLLPVMLLATALIGKLFGLALKGALRAKAALAACAIILFLQGGGVFTFIARSDASWYWPNTTVIRVNNAARHLLSPFTVEGSKDCSKRLIC